MHQAPIMTCIPPHTEVRNEDPHTTIPDYTVGMCPRCLADFRSVVKRGRHWNLLTLHVDGSVVATDVCMATSSLTRTYITEQKRKGFSTPLHASFFLV